MSIPFYKKLDSMDYGASYLRKIAMHYDKTYILKSMFFNIVFLLLLISINFNLNAQNLVPNGSFEYSKKCSEQYWNWLDVPNDWGGYGLEYSSYAEHYNPCGLPKHKGMPNNMMGFQYARTGNSYIGMNLYPQYNNDFIQTKLCDTLKAGMIYHVSFYVSLANKSNCAINSIGAFLSKKRIKIEHANYPENTATLALCKPQIVNDTKLILKDTLNWVKISGEYIAQGGETYLIIGNFNIDKQTQKEAINKLGKDGNSFTYYFIDDVCVSVIKDSRYDCDCSKENGCKCFIPDTTTPKYKIGKPIILNNILFETAKSVLLPKSKEELINLILFLKNNKKLSIEFSGHTDKDGTEKDNQLLSENRAKAVADYLISHGINKSRVSYKGYGSIKPIASNNTNEGKAKNRRVEIIILKK